MTEVPERLLRRAKERRAGEMMKSPEGSEPEGEGWLKPWVAAEQTFIAEGAITRSIIGGTRKRPLPLVAVDLQGHWQGSEDTVVISLICHAEVGEDMGVGMIEAAKAVYGDVGAFNRGETRGHERNI